MGPALVPDGTIAFTWVGLALTTSPFLWLKLTKFPPVEGEKPLPAMVTVSPVFTNTGAKLWMESWANAGFTLTRKSKICSKSFPARGEGLQNLMENAVRFLLWVAYGN